jgi:hypothetical protein
MPSLEVIPINSVCKSDGFRGGLNPSYMLLLYLIGGRGSTASPGSIL